MRGEPAGYQTRPDSPRLGRNGKPVKYETPKGQKPLIDVHPWAAIKRTSKEVGEDGSPVLVPPLIADPRIRLFITEGIRKADCLFGLTFCCIALLGVWAFRGKNAVGGYTALADWESIGLKGREVYIVYDSDVMTKDSPAKALARLKPFLESRGARVRVIYLPSNGPKVGVDDWVFAQKASGKDHEAIRRDLLALAEDELRPPLTEPGPEKRPMILVRGGQLPVHVDKALKVVAQHYEQVRLFERPAVPDFVYIHVNPAEEIDKQLEIRRRAGAVTMRQVTRPLLEDKLTRAINWRRHREIQGDEVSIDCPRRIAETALSRAGNGELPELVGIVEAPIMRSDGSILNQPAYDPATGLFLYSSEIWLEVPDRPTHEDIEAAKAVLLEPIAQFPFVDEAARSVVLSGMMTSVQRRLLPSAPIHALDAPMQSSGKTLLGDVVGIIATGRDATSISVPKELDEMRKRLTSILLAGDLVVSIDNVERPLECEALATITTKEEYGDRILGTMNVAKVRTNVLFLVTGNNLVFSGDLSSRVIISRIDPKVEKPEERGGWNIPDLRQYMHDHRPQIVHAILTILRAHYVEGRPGMGLTPFGRFEVWTSQIRSALVWAGFADPVITRKSVVDNDPEKDRTAAVLIAWREHRELGLDRPFTTKQVIQAANTKPNAPKVEAAQDDNLRTALMEVALPKRGGSEEPNSQLLGTWCNNHFDRPVEGLVLVKAGKDTHLKTALWAVKDTIVWAAEVAGTAGTCGYRSSPSARENETYAHNNGNHNNDNLNTPGGKEYPHDPAHPANSLNGFAPKADVEVVCEYKAARLRHLADELYIDRLAQADGWDPAAEPSSAAAEESPDGFLGAYTPEHADRICLARALVLDLETTGLSSFSKKVQSVEHIGPRRLRRSRPIDTGGFFPQVPADLGNYYADTFPICSIDTTLRVRIISVQLVETGWTAAWDLDRLAPDDRRQLAHDVLAGKIVIGHNVSFDLNWLGWLTDALPARILDSMLIAKWHAHCARLEVHKKAAQGDEACKAFVKKADGAGAGFSLDQCAAAFGLAMPDKTYQGAHNWCVTELSPDHYEYCCGDVVLPLGIITKALKLKADAGLDAVLGALEGGVYVRDCEPALLSLAAHID